MHEKALSFDSTPKKLDERCSCLLYSSVKKMKKNKDKGHHFTAHVFRAVCNWSLGGPKSQP